MKPKLSVDASILERGLSQQLLAGRRLLILEDEFLIAMDVEQVCRDHGADSVVICKSVDEANGAAAGFDAAIVDMMLNGESTVPFARDLMSRGVPFIFASGYSDRTDIAEQFPGVTIVPKPYSSDDLVAALAGAIEAPRS